MKTGSLSPVGEGWVSWKHIEVGGITFELAEKLHTEPGKPGLRLGGVVRSLNSEIADVALQIFMEDAQGRGRESGSAKRPSERLATRAKDATDGGGS